MWFVGIRKMLNLEQAVELYKTLGPYLPQNYESLESLKYVSHIIKNIKKDKSSAYVNSILIMYDINIKDLKDKDTKEILNMFIRGLSENKFVSLCEFLRSFEYGKRKSS